ncbi:hypothetical protein ACFV8T_44180 [Streptomyces sp. NPDC059832]
MASSVALVMRSVPSQMAVMAAWRMRCGVMVGFSEVVQADLVQ